MATYDMAERERMGRSKPTDQRTPLAALAADDAPVERRRPALLLAVAAGLCWACAAALLISGGLEGDRALLSVPRLIFYALVLGPGC